jgi:hypothetical protein
VMGLPFGLGEPIVDAWPCVISKVRCISHPEGVNNDGMRHGLHSIANKWKRAFLDRLQAGKLRRDNDDNNKGTTTSTVVHLRTPCLPET